MRRTRPNESRATITSRSLLAVLLLVAMLASACAADEGAADEGDDGAAVTQAPAATTAAPTTTEMTTEMPASGVVGGAIVVQAAASLTDAFTGVASAFGEDNPDATVTFNFAGSQALATQIIEGAPADVFASANSTQMDVVVEEGLVDGEPEVFVTNQLAIAVEAGNPFGIGSLQDLADPELVLVLADPEVPVGNVAAHALEAAGVTVTPSSLEVDVRSVLSRVELGEADAGIVYTSDLVTAGDTVEGVVISEEDNVVAEYPIATLTEAPNPDGADAFITFVRSAEGQAILEEYGFAGV